MHGLNVPPRCSSSLNEPGDADAARLTPLVPAAHVISIADEVCDLAHSFRAPSLMDDLEMPTCALTGNWSSKLRPVRAAPPAQARHRKGSPEPDDRAIPSSHFKSYERSVAMMRRSLEAMRRQTVNCEAAYDARYNYNIGRMNAPYPGVLSAVSIRVFKSARGWLPVLEESGMPMPYLVPPQRRHRRTRNPGGCEIKIACAGGQLAARGLPGLRTAGAVAPKQTKS
jgi:hypothetical protein